MFKEALVEIFPESVFKCGLCGIPVDGISEIQFAVLFQQSGILRCQVDLNDLLLKKRR